MNQLVLHWEDNYNKINKNLKSIKLNYYINKTHKINKIIIIIIINKGASPVEASTAGASTAGASTAGAPTARASAVEASAAVA